jgi:hypothetical protein
MSRAISFGILREQLVEVEDRRDLAAQIEQRREHLCSRGNEEGTGGIRGCLPIILATSWIL